MIFYAKTKVEPRAEHAVGRTKSELCFEKSETGDDSFTKANKNILIYLTFCEKELDPTWIEYF